MRKLLTALIILAPSICLADVGVRDFIFPSVENDKLQEKNEHILSTFREEHYDEASNAVDQTLNEAQADTSIDKNSYARILNNAAIIHALTNKRELALTELDQSIELLDKSDPFQPDLFNILMVKGFIEYTKQLYDESEDSFRWAQHIIHRQRGVYTPLQLPAVELITRVLTAEGKLEAADTQARFMLKVNERYLGANSLEVVPMLVEVGSYFATRGNSLPISSGSESHVQRDQLFRESIQLLEQAINNIEMKFGPDDLRLVSPLKALSRSRYMQGYSRAKAKKSMERMLDIVAKNPATDKIDHAAALIDLADLYILLGDERSSETYLQAWHLLADDSNNSDLLGSYFGEPKRLYPEKAPRGVLYRQPAAVEEGQELYINLKYDIEPEGRVDNVEFIEGNIPNSARKVLRNFVSQMKFRPAIADGELQTTKGVLLHQVYQVEEPLPKEDLKVSPELESNLRTRRYQRY